MPRKNNIQEYGECQEPEDSFCKDTRNRNLSFPFVFKCFSLLEIMRWPHLKAEEIIRSLNMDFIQYWRKLHKLVIILEMSII